VPTSDAVSALVDASPRFHLNVLQTEFFSMYPVCAPTVGDEFVVDSPKSWLRRPSNREWLPPHSTLAATNALQLFDDWVQALGDTEEHLTRLQHRPNLSHGEREALRSLRNRADIVLRSADKGLGPCVIQREVYLDMQRDHLCDTGTYVRVHDDPDAVLQRWKRRTHNMLTGLLGASPEHADMVLSTGDHRPSATLLRCAYAAQALR